MSDWKLYLREHLQSARADGATEAESIEELAQHLADCEAEALAGGADPEAARQAALSQLPDLGPLREEIGRRAAGAALAPSTTPRPLFGLAHDLRYAVRLLRRGPGFAAVAVLTLALGIGANTAVFSLVNGVLLKPLPFPDANRLVALFHFSRGERAVMSPPNFIDLRAGSRTLATAAAYTEQGYTLTGAGEPVRLRGAQVTDRFFDVLGVPAFLGRHFRRDENEPGHASVVVLGHELWQERFAGDRQIVGKTVTIDSTPSVVVGVMPAGFAWPAAAQLWTPFEQDAVFTSASRGAWYLEAIGRLKPNASAAETANEAALIAKRLSREYPDKNTNLSFTALPLHEAYVGGTRLSLLVLLGAVGFVLLIACVNVGNLLLARASKRSHEIALRAALGAGRSRVLQQMMAESAVLATCGGVSGLAVGYALTRLFVAFAPEDLPRLNEVGLDGRVLAFTAATAVVTVVLFSIAPAWRLARTNLAIALREGSAGAVSRGRSSRTRSVLVVAETALAVALLVGAGLLLASFTRLQRVDPGFRSEGVLTFQLSLPDSSYREATARSAFFDRLLARLGHLPGVRDAGAVMVLPMSGDNYVFTFEIAGRPPFPPGSGQALVTQVATPGYFRALGIPLRRGRLFTDADAASAPRVMLISESAARRYFPNEDPIGKRISLGWRVNKERVGGEIVGVVGDVHEMGLRERQPAEAYVPHRQTPVSALCVALNTTLPPMTLARPAEQVVRELDPNLPLMRVRTMQQRVSASVGTDRFYAGLVAAFAAIALALAAVGVFGVLSFMVAERTREIGIRMALGCEPARVMTDVVARAMALAALGLLAGVGMALPLSRVLAGLLFETAAGDPVILVTIVCLLALVALAASYVPARRATRVDPLVALRSE